MPKFLDTRGLSSLAIGVCDRCNFKYPIVKLRPDGDNPGLRVCKECRDELDPYKLPARQPDPTVVRFPRPDVSLTVSTASLTTEGGETLTTESGSPYEPEGDYFLP